MNIDRPVRLLSGNRGMRRLSFVFLFLPPYRTKFIGELMARYGEQITVFIGDRTYSEALPHSTHLVALATEGQIVRVSNKVLGKSGLLLQHGRDFWALAWREELIVLPLGPKILSSWLLGIARALQGRRTLYYGHATGRLGSRSLGNWIRWLQVALSSGVLCYTRTEESVLRGLFRGKRAYGLGNSSLRRSECVASAGKDYSGAIRLLYVGRLVAEKNVGLIVRLSAELKRMGIEHDIRVVGDGPMRTEMLESIRELQLESEIELIGWEWEDAKLKSYYWESHLALSPGYIGLAAIQAFGYGVPMAVAYSPRHAPEVEACKEGFNCMFFDPRSVRDFAKAVIGLFAAQRDGRIHAEAIARDIYTNYTVESMCDQVMRATLELSQIEDGCV